ncbi:delta-aminolevulinic acid dehydratase [bacterium Unc6]|nr:delta-aminolevulinic acid dehydratase [bacterium Unc6]
MAFNRLRRNQIIRNLVSETRLVASDLIQPYFVIEGKNKKEVIKSMPGVYRLSIDNLLKDIKETKVLDIKAILLFGIPRKKDKKGTEAYAEGGIIQKTVRAIRKEIKDIIIITDVCLCGYTPYGHCRILKKNAEVLDVDVDGTLDTLAKIAVSHAQAGADFVAPSAMMLHQVKAIRKALDKNDFVKTKIFAYSAKYASNFYAPFREALNSAPRFGDRMSYQLDFGDPSEALKRIGQDIDEGADMVMVKPALAYLDIIYRAKEKFNIPIAAYNVSGEYSAIKKLSEGDKTKEKELALEVLTSIKRAGADFIISYFGKEVGKWLMVDGV